MPDLPTLHHVVREQDVQPHGWVCEGCGKPFTPGDYAVVLLVGLTYDGVPVEGDAECLSCFTRISHD